MSLPLTVNNTYAANQSVSAQDIVDMQEQIAARWRGRHRLRRMQLSVYAAQDGGSSFSGQQFNTWGAGFRAAAGANQHLFFTLRLRYNTRIRNIRVAYQAVGGAVLPFQLRRNYQPGGTIVPLASGNLAVAGGAYNVASLFGAPLPKHAIARFGASPGIDVHFTFVVTSGGAGDRVYGISVDYDHIGISL